MGYIDNERTISHIGYIPEMAGGDGGAYMNAYDFHKVIESFLEGKIISSNLVKEFMTPHIKTDEGDDIYYGYGLWLKKCGDAYIPYVIGVDAGIRFKSLFTKDSFYYIVTNTNDDIWDMMDELESLACSVQT
jgi:CubicO group peptidase (beta-lactamase class C family)